MTLRIALAATALLTLAACSPPDPVVTSATPERVMLTASSGIGTGFASEQEVRVTAQRACEQFGRNAGSLLQGNATDRQRSFQFACIER